MIALLAVLNLLEPLVDFVKPVAKSEMDYVETSVSRGEITFVMEASALPPGEYVLKAEVEGAEGTRRFTSEPLAVTNGTLRFSAPWADARLWDTDTPGNRYVCRLRAEGTTVNAVREADAFSFGFREIVIEGRDLLLNGRVLHLRALHNRLAVTPDDDDPYGHARQACERILSDGFNAVIMSNYDFHREAFQNLDGLLRACDETGLLLSFSLPHEREFGLVGDPGHAAAYRDEAAYAISLARNHPSVILYAANHNICGYTGDINPLRIDGLYELDGDTNRWRNAQRAGARVTRGIVRELDPTRPMYHHESGNLDDFHTINCYLDWAPVQERSDWFAHWSEEGVKPLFLVEWGLPHIASWSSYRGPQFIWRCTAFQSLWASEYAAMLRGDAAYEETEEVRRALATEEALWARGQPFSWGELCGALRAVTNNYLGIQAAFAADNWRSMRAWGVTAMLPWDQEGLADAKGRKTVLGEVFDRWNQPDCAFIGGDGVFTDKRHLYRPGESVAKQLVILNDRRRDQRVGWRCTLVDATGRTLEERTGSVDVAAGGRALVPVSFTPAAAGDYRLEAAFAFGAGERTDSFPLTALAQTDRTTDTVVGLYDPRGMTRETFDRLGVPYELMEGDIRATSATRLVIGREALTEEVYRRLVRPVLAAGGRVLLFEQTAEVLEAIGLRTAKYALRTVFPRGGGLFGPGTDRLRDWAGEATLLPPFLGDDPACEVDYRSEMWCGFRNTRVWRCGNRGAVASVLVEKPTKGDWLAYCDGGFDLQYAPLLRWRVGAGAVWFCQLDVTARTVADPSADDAVREILVEMDRPLAPADDRAAVYRTGDAKPDGFDVAVAAGATALCLGFSSDEVAAWSPESVACAPTNGCFFSRIDRIPSELDGLSNADWAWHGAMDFAAFQDRVPDGNAAIRIVRHGAGRIVFVQVPPEQIDDQAKPYLRTSRRRANGLIERLKANLGIASPVDEIAYAETPVAEDDPYRYYRW